MLKYQITQNGNKIDYVLLVMVLALVVVGIFAVFSSSAYVAQFKYNNSAYFLIRQVIYTIVGLIGMFVAMKLDFYHLRKYSKVMIIGNAFLLMCTYFSFLGGTVVNGANGWIIIPVINQGFQPSEIAKIVALIYVANILAYPNYKNLDIFTRILTTIPIAGLLGIVVFQPDMGNTSIITMAVLSVYFSAGLSKKLILSVMSFVGVLVTAIIASNPYQLDRVLFFLNPWQDPQGKGFQLIQSLLAVGSGGITGRGLGQSIQKLFYLPESHNDFIFAVFAEETGLIGTLTMIFFFFVVLTRGLNIAVKNKDSFIKLLCTGITILITGQTFMNIGVVTGILPTTGITLPFISSGGTSMIVNLFCIGLLLNASSYTYTDWEVIEGNSNNNENF
ncbi:MAG: putative lipid II flippase FtsW [Candidatus Sericytochromatia bacterium]